MTKTIEIYWTDLNASAKKRLKKDLYHENIDISPIAVIEIEEEYEPDDIEEPDTLKREWRNNYD